MILPASLIAEQGGSHSGERIVALDALRGFAVIGIAWMNVHAFALPLQAYYNPIAWGLESPADLWTWRIGFVLIEDKFRTLFAMLFGAGIAMLWEVVPNGRRWRPHLARMAVLFAIGIMHASLLASNDILRAYALAGLALPLLLGLSGRGLLGAAAIALGVHLFAGAVLLREYSALVQWNYGAVPEALAAGVEFGREGFAERVVRRVLTLPQSLASLAMTLPGNLAAMLVGMAAWRAGLLAGRWRRSSLRLLGIALAALAVPGLLLIAIWMEAQDFSASAVAAGGLFLSAPFDLALGVAYAALAMALFTRRADAAPVRALAATGRMSLTNYVATSFVFAALFASWGFGLFAEVNRAQALALSFVPIAAMLAWSPAWLAHHSRGPLEALWRGAARKLADS